MLYLKNDELAEDRYFIRTAKLVKEQLSCTIWPKFSSFFIFFYYFTHLKAREIVDNDDIVFGTVRNACVGEISHLVPHFFSAQTITLSRTFFFT